MEIISDFQIPGLPLQAHSTSPKLPISTQTAWKEFQAVDETLLRLPGHDSAKANLHVTRSLLKRFYRLKYRDEAEFVVADDGSGIWSRWPNSMSVEDIATYLLGPVIGLVLRLRGTTCLHAAAVEIEGALAAFTGPAGAGKSSICAAMALTGLAVSGDDVLPLVKRGGGYHACAAYPRIRLWPDSVAALCGSEDALERLTPTWDKRFLSLNEAGRKMIEGERKLGCVYVLSEQAQGPEVSIESLAGREAIMAIVANTYANYLLDSTTRAQELEFVSGLVKSVPVFRLCVPKGLELLNATCEGIAEHFRLLRSNVHL